MKRWTLLVLLAGLASANPTVRLTPAERAKLNTLRAEAHGEHAYDKAYARAWLCMAEESKDPVEIRRALRACGNLYTFDLSASATINGEPYQRLLINQEYKDVVRRLLRGPVANVREDAAMTAADCVSGSQPDRSFFPLLKAAFQREPDGNARANILSAVSLCRSPDPAVAELILMGLRDPHSKVLRAALGIIARRYHKGTEYGSAFRAQASPTIQKSFKRSEPDLRVAALGCLVEMTPREQRRTALNGAFARMLGDRDGGVVASTLYSIQTCKATRMIGPVSQLLDDTRPDRLELASVDDDLTHGSTGNGSTVQHHALECLHILTQELSGSDGFRYAHHRVRAPQEPLAGEVHRARLWLQEHAEYLNTP